MKNARELIEGAAALLLDFDGPVTTLMPPPLNAAAADRARAALQNAEVPVEVQETSDHLAILRWTVEHASGRVADVEHACTEAEVECARRSLPSPEIRDLLLSAQAREVPVVIVSNNSEEAVGTFLQRFDWADTIRLYVGRTEATVRLLKPDPYLVDEAVRLIGIEPSRCIFIGDSVSDVQAGRAAGVPVVGLAKSGPRGEQLAAAGADALLTR